MNKNILIGISAALVIAVGGWWYWNGYQADKSGKESNINMPSGSANAAIQNFSFTPGELHIKIGNKVVWTNKDSFNHSVVSDAGEFQSDALSTGKSFEFTFNQKGTYLYHCGIHPSMKGAVIVE